MSIIDTIKSKYGNQSPQKTPPQYVIEYLRTDSVVVFVRNGGFVGALDGNGKEIKIGTDIQSGLLNLSNYDFMLVGELASGCAYISDVLSFNNTEMMSKTWSERRKLLRKFNYSPDVIENTAIIVKDKDEFLKVFNMVRNSCSASYVLVKGYNDACEGMRFWYKVPLGGVKNETDRKQVS